MPWDGNYAVPLGGSGLHRFMYTRTTAAGGSHAHSLTTGNASADHTHSVDIASFSSGSAGSSSASTDTASALMPYLQLTACVSP